MHPNRDAFNLSIKMMCALSFGTPYCMRNYLEAFRMARDVEVVDGDLGVFSYKLPAVRTGGHTHSAETGIKGQARGKVEKIPSLQFLWNEQ